MIESVIAKLTARENLAFPEAKRVFSEIFTGEVLPVQIASFLTALKMKGESELEIAAAAQVIREKAKKINAGGQAGCVCDILDTCGTGGSGVAKFNISTAVAFVMAASGVKVAKHGNKAMSSASGSADILQELGINISAASEVMEKALNQLGICFLYAPLYHPALKTVAEVRRQLKIRTIFNILGPLCSPASANYQLLGVYDTKLILPMAKVLQNLGIKRAFVVCSKDLKDEISLSGPTRVSFVDGKKIKKLTFSAASFGLKKIKPKAIASSSPAESAAMVKEVFSGKKGPARDIVLANAAACFYLLNKVKKLKDGVATAALAIDSGKTYDLLEKFKSFLKENA